MRSWSIPAGKFFGVELRVHLTFLFLLFFVFLTESTARTTASPWRSLALVGIVFASVVLHELGHALVSTRAGVPAKAIILLPIGGVTLMDETRQPSEPGAQTWKRDIRIALAGPVVNIVVALVAGLVVYSFLPQAHLAAKPYVISSNLPRSLVWSNVWLALFNLLPAYPMDGGRVLRALFSRNMDPVSATRRAVSIGRGFAIAFLLAGIWYNWFFIISA